MALAAALRSAFPRSNDKIIDCFPLFGGPKTNRINDRRLPLSLVSFATVNTRNTA
jgi:hypothetical protein